MEINKKNFLVFFKVCVSIFILIYVFQQVDIKSLYQIIKDADKIYILLAFMVLLLQYMICVFRWQGLLKALKINIPINRLLVSVSGSVFFSLLPFVSVIGGDIARSSDLSHYTRRSREVITTVFLDRLSGYVGLALLAFSAFILGDIQDKTTFFFISIIILVMVLIILILFNNFFYSLVNKVLHSSKTTGLRKDLKNIHHELHIFKRNKLAMVKSVLFSLLIQICSSVIWIGVALSLGIKSKLIYFFIFTPIVGVITMLPISVGAGLGVREYFTKLFFTKIGITVDKAVALSLVNSLFVIIAGLIGGIIYVLTVHHRRIQRHQPSAVS